MIEKGQVTVFKGIPYAKPPVGDLRWRPPQAMEPWTDTLACHKFGPTGIQRGGGEFAEFFRQLLRYKLPRSIEFVTAPLRDDAGKVRRKALREARLEISTVSA